MAREHGSLVALLEVDDSRLEELIEVATAAASADEVTPPITDGDVWTRQRVAWLREFHLDRRSGLEGAEREATWVVVRGDRVVGSVRLKRTEDKADKAVLEAGIWLARHARGHGIGRAALTAVVRQAADLNAAAVRAETTCANVGACAVLRRLGFELHPSADGRSVRALLVIEPAPAAPDETRPAR